MTLYLTTVFYLSVKLPLNILRIKISQVWIQLNKPVGNKQGVGKATRCRKKGPLLEFNQVHQPGVANE